MCKVVCVVVADDQPKARLGLRLLLEREPELKIIGEAAEAATLMLQIRRTQPDLLLLDWELPGLQAAAIVAAGPGVAPCPIQALRKIAPYLKVLALSGRPEARQAALAAGVDAFISKAEPPERLLTTVRQLI